MTRRVPKYHRLALTERLHFHAVRCLYHALVTWDTFEAYRQATIGLSVLREMGWRP